jgi:hypothetical protein
MKIILTGWPGMRIILTAASQHNRITMPLIDRPTGAASGAPRFRLAPTLYMGLPGRPVFQVPSHGRKGRRAGGN